MRTSLLPALWLVAAACSAHARAPSDPDPTAATGVAPAVDHGAPLAFVAVVTSHVSKVIATESDGRVMKLLVHDDQYVHAGDLVAQLDVQELRAQLDAAVAKREAARAEAARAGALANQARRKARLEARLMRLGASAPESFRSARSDASAASAESGVAAGQIREASASIEELQRLIAAANIRAPIDGVISAVKTREGEVAHKGTAIARVFDPHDLVVKFAVPRDHRAQVRIGQRVALVYDGGERPVTVSAINDDHDPAIDFLQVEAQLDPARPGPTRNASSTLRPDDVHVGISGHVRIPQPQGVAR